MITEVSPVPDAGGFSTIDGSHLTRRGDQISGRSVVPRQLVIQVLVLRLKQTGRSVLCGHSVCNVPAAILQENNVERANKA